MSSIRTFVRPLAVALTFAFAVAPASAFAEGGRPVPTEAKEGKGHGKKHGKHEGKKDGAHRKFPIEAAKFQQGVDKRISKARERLESVMTKRNAPDALKVQIRKEFEAGVVYVQAAAKRVGADGTVTKEEAKEVRDLAKSLKQKAREKLGGGKKGKANA